MTQKPVKPSYFGEVALSGVSAVACIASVLVSIFALLSWGAPVGFAPFALYASVLLTAGLGLSRTRFWRQQIDEAFRREQRDHYRVHILREIMLRVPVEMDGYRIKGKNFSGLRDADQRRLEGYNNMVERIRSLSSVVMNGSTHVGKSEIERLHAASLDYLSLWLSKLVLDTRNIGADTQGLRQEIKKIEERLRSALPGVETRHLIQAKNDYMDMISRRESVPARGFAIDAALLSMPDKVEEIYQIVLGSSLSQSLDVGNKIEDCLARLRIEEALESELSDDALMRSSTRNENMVPSLPPVTAKKSAQEKEKLDLARKMSQPAS